MKYCPGCGAILKNGSKCDNCGLVLDGIILTAQAFEEPKKEEEEKRYDVCSIVGFILSIVSFFFCGILSIPALIVSIIGYTLCIVDDKKGRWMAETGIISSIISTILFIAMLILFNS